MFSVHDKALHSLSAEPLSRAYPSTLVTLIYTRGLQSPISTVRKHTETQHMLVAFQSSDHLSSAQQGDNTETRGTGSSCGQPHHRGSSLSTSSAAVVGETLMLCPSTSCSYLGGQTFPATGAVAAVLWMASPHQVLPGAVTPLVVTVRSCGLAKANISNAGSALGS